MLTMYEGRKRLKSREATRYGQTSSKFGSNAKVFYTLILPMISDYFSLNA